jgi:hypothetical protein
MLKNKNYLDKGMQILILLFEANTIHRLSWFLDLRKTRTVSSCFKALRVYTMDLKNHREYYQYLAFTALRSLRINKQIKKG